MTCSEKGYFGWAIYSENYDPQPCTCSCHEDPAAWDESKPQAGKAKGRRPTKL
jgi:hypothetical protein